MIRLNVEAQEVRVGDRIYVSRGYRGATWDKVTSVRKVETSRGGRLDAYIVLECAAQATWRHPREAVAVQREEGVEWS